MNQRNERYKNDIEDMIALGFDGVKFDAGGGNDDMNRWAKQLNQSGRPVMIENCNNGACEIIDDSSTSFFVDSRTLQCPLEVGSKLPLPLCVGVRKVGFVTSAPPS